MNLRHTLVVLAAAVAPVSPAQAETPVIQGWTLAAPDYDRDRIAELDAAIDAERFRSINSVIVIRDGELLIERYYNGADRDTLHNPRSVGKTFASAVLGIAIAEKHIPHVSQPLSAYYDLEQYPNFSPSKAQVTLKHLLTMTSGFEGNDSDRDSPGNEENMYPQENWVEWTLALPMAKDRGVGESWHYFTAGVVVLGDVINRSVPGGLESYADAKLFAPMGVRHYQWQHTPQRVANTAGGVQLTPLGFARFGELYRRGGELDGRRILARAWVEASLSPAADTGDGENRYGYLWWMKDYRVGDETWPVAYCTGNGGNKIFVFREQPLVVVVTASAYGRRYAHAQVDEMMEQFVLPALK